MELPVLLIIWPLQGFSWPSNPLFGGSGFRLRQMRSQMRSKGGREGKLLLQSQISSKDNLNQPFFFPQVFSVVVIFFSDKMYTGQAEQSKMAFCHLHFSLLFLSCFWQSEPCPSWPKWMLPRAVGGQGLLSANAGLLHFFIKIVCQCRSSSLFH